MGAIKRLEQAFSIIDGCVMFAAFPRTQQGNHVQAVPTHEALIASLDRLFVLETTDGQRLEVRLAAAPAGIAMDETYVSYSATFELPVGMWLPQDTYRMTAPDGASWELFATPTRPSADGRANLTAVVHISVPKAPPSTT